MCLDPMATLLDVTQHLVDQIKLMNEHVTSQTAGPILARVIEKLDRKERAFNETEERKLCGMLKLDDKQLQDVLETAGYVFEQCAYFGASSDALSKELSGAGLNSDIVSAFVTVWDEGGAMLRAKLSERSICANRLVSSDWSLHLQMGQQDMTRIKKPVAIVSLTTQNQDLDQNETKNYEFTHEQLIAFSKNLDRIQDQLDNLG